MATRQGLLQRLEQLQQHQEGRLSLEEFQALALSEMGEHIITFGKAHLGKTYRDVWKNHPDWIKYMVSRFADKTDKPEHLKLLHYVSLMVERAELETNPITPAGTGTVTGRGSPPPASRVGARAKAHAKAAAVPTTAPVEEVPVPEEESEIECWIEDGFETVPPAAIPQEKKKAMQNRMQNIESALSEVIRCLRQG